MTTFNDQVAVEATIAKQVWRTAFGALMAEVADCFPRRDARLLARDMTEAMLMKLERRNCWTLAEALGHDGPWRLQHFLSRGSWDHHLARDRLASWVSGELAEGDAVLVVDETGGREVLHRLRGRRPAVLRRAGRDRAVPGCRAPDLRLAARARADRPGVVPARRLGAGRGAPPARTRARRGLFLHQAAACRRHAAPGSHPGRTCPLVRRR
ncbi:transposase [Streptomyces sp. UH6]|nr:transposase [Streptomyces sp. UH6]